ncbi:hypothetical protein [Caldivirga maquilingensis]|uniref:Uncharacterized protein n=1 Tax=Caldivirga maquilingensis (strain ATCC 700844 / DSM 13496 / JCM 10307 / IC-167) TaxID=397948 RepID=A8MBH0_CALMQ|nr:hypothetical protein [Caldivirga maquilingensis]ABW02703.1 hypothetical protein Cmaq_1886 [Caldivirga maquilingensis IC-167]
MPIKPVYVVLGLSLLSILLSTIAMVHSYLGINELFMKLEHSTYSSKLVYELVGIAILDIATFTASVFVVKESFLDVATSIYVHEEVMARMRRVMAFMGIAFSSISIIMVLIAIASVI